MWLYEKEYKELDLGIPRFEKVWLYEKELDLGIPRF